MNPEGSCSLTSDFQEEYRWYFFNGLYEMFAEEEAAGHKVRTCTDPEVRVWTVFVI